MLELLGQGMEGTCSVSLLEGKGALSDAGCHVQRWASSLMCTPGRYKTGSLLVPFLSL